MIPVSVIICTKNEEANLPHSLPPLIKNFEQVIVVDSNSTDKTVEIAKDGGAEIVNFTWDGQYPKKRQWCLKNLDLKHNWVLMIDADEIITNDVIAEIQSLSWDADGYFIPSKMVWNGKELQHGWRNNKLCLFKRSVFFFPIIDDLDIEGMGEIEGHYQPVTLREEKTIGQIKSPLIHHNHKDSWNAKHDAYAHWEIEMNKRKAWPADPVTMREIIKDTLRTSWTKPYLYFLYGYVIKGGFRDGKAGLDYALKRFDYTRRIVRGSRQTSDGL